MENEKDKKMLQTFTTFIENVRIKKLKDKATGDLKSIIQNLPKEEIMKYTQRAVSGLTSNYKLTMQKMYYGILSGMNVDYNKKNYATMKERLSQASGFKDVFTDSEFNRIELSARIDFAIKITRNFNDYVKQIEQNKKLTASQKVLAKDKLTSQLTNFYISGQFTEQQIAEIKNKASDTNYIIIEYYTINTDVMELWVGVR